MTNFDALKSQAELLLAKLEQGKHYVIGDLNSRLQKAAEDNPQDIVIRSVASVIEQAYHKNPEVLVSQGDMEKIYNELVGLNASGTRFREILGDLLLSETQTRDVTNVTHVNGLRDDPEAGSVNYGVDKEVKSGLDQLFQAQFDKYDPQLAGDAKQKVGLELESMGFRNSRIRLAGGNSRFLIFAADLDTNRGAIRVYIPTESTGTKFPSVFVAGNRFENFTATDLRTHLEEAAFRNDRLPKVSAILHSLDLAVKADQQNVSDEDFNKVASALPQENGSEGVSSPGLFANLPDQKDNIRDVEIPATPVPKELKVVASDLEESVMEAAVGYPQATVRLAKRMIIVELGSMGFQGSQVRVASATHDGFICEATLNTPRGKFNVEIPIEMNGNAPLLPTVFAKGDYVAKFNAANLHALAMQEAGTAAVSVNRDSAMYGMTLHELKDEIVHSASKQDLAACDEVMEIISQRFDEDTYRAVVADYHAMLTGIKQSKENLKQSFDDSDQFVRTPNSLYPVHKKLGLPAHELVRDESGMYHKKSTYQAQKEAEGGFFSTAKALVGD
jgi:hypothetical protein